ncbi:ABC transporter permease [Bradyrhizobium sp. Pha-3]|uniref:ABC transporter permease n=1 Tax=Bradyrhizobium sp. Pha-3 TaxID=208375 RepID=UPI0035D42CFD
MNLRPKLGEKNPPAAVHLDGTVTRQSAKVRIDAQSLALLLFLLSLCAMFASMSPHFLTFSNLRNILLSVAVMGAMAPVMTLVLISRNLDLSVGSIFALTCVVGGMALEEGYPAFITITYVVGLGLLCGLINASIIVWLRIDSIIVTIATLSIIRGVAFVITNGRTTVITDEAISELGSGRIAGVPYSVLLMLVIFLACGVVAKYSRLGRAIYAIGSNVNASRLSGIAINRHIYYVFAASGASAAIAALLFMGQAAAAMPGAGVGYELLVLTAVLLGGTSLHGGEGRISGTLLGVIIIGVLNNGMILLGVNSYLQMAAHGLLLLIAVGIDQLRRRAV